MARPSLEHELRELEEDRRRHGDFGDLGDLEAGEIDEDEDAFVKRLDKNKNAQQQPTQPKGPRPGARDRRRAREGGSKTNTDSSVNGDAEPKKSFQPFKHFTEPPGVKGQSLNRPRSLSPPGTRRREGRQPSPVAMDSPAQARSAANWQKDRGLKDRVQGGRQPGRGGGGGFASGSLLDRIDRGSSNSTSNNARAPASRDPRNFDSQAQRQTRPWDARAAPPEPKRRANGYTPHPEPSTDSNSRNNNNRRGGNPHYKGGYF
ncbi:hypothetical protein P389DRAFT_164944 [Cystobasidium minutum MCA 4210]|uniref:uncharacterized protein n=1 Tax=Cystobasidium minutum MCA 4210 TaxID=1397322 RepID=UPI0034CD1549|eukprot:jgi/Rhomi1/164944/fgenesh1_kg.1_\